MSFGAHVRRKLLSCGTSLDKDDTLTDVHVSVYFIQNYGVKGSEQGGRAEATQKKEKSTGDLL